MIVGKNTIQTRIEYLRNGLGKISMMDAMPVFFDVILEVLQKIESFEAKLPKKKSRGKR